MESTESFKELLAKLAIRHESEVAELRARLAELEQQQLKVQTAVSVEGEAEAGRGEMARAGSRQSEELRASKQWSFISSLWRSGGERQMRATSSGLGLRRILQEGQPKPSLISGASHFLHGAENTLVVALLFKYLEWWHQLHEPPRSGCLVRVLHSRTFQNISMIAILFNAVWITYLTDWSLQHPMGGNPQEYQMVDLAFIVFFFLELVLRLAVHRLYFFINYNAGWQLVPSGTAGGAGSNDILHLGWLVLLGVDVVRALLFAQGVADALQAQQAPPELLDLVMETFGSVLKTMLSLYMAVTGGNDWSMYYATCASMSVAKGGLGRFVRVFLRHIHRGSHSSQAYTFFFAFAIFNILTGIFVERAVAASLPDREQQILLERRKLLEQANELRDLFSCMDLDDSGNISLEDMLLKPKRKSSQRIESRWGSFAVRGGEHRPRQDPVLSLPEGYYLACRCSTTLRSTALAFGVYISSAAYWKPYAEERPPDHLHLAIFVPDWGMLDWTWGRNPLGAEGSHAPMGAGSALRHGRGLGRLLVGTRGCVRTCELEELELEPR
eukprot:g22502.t1